MLLLCAERVRNAALAVGTVQPGLKLLKHARLDGVGDESDCAFALLFVVLVPDACDPWVQASLLERFERPTNSYCCYLCRRVFLSMKRYLHARWQSSVRCPS